MIVKGFAAMNYENDKLWQLLSDRLRKYGMHDNPSAIALTVTDLSKVRKGDHKFWMWVEERVKEYVFDEDPDLTILALLISSLAKMRNRGTDSGLIEAVIKLYTAESYEANTIDLTMVLQALTVFV